MATNRTIFKNTLYGSELFELYTTIDESPKLTVNRHQMSFHEIKKKREFAKRVMSIDPDKWTRTVLNQLRVKALSRATKYQNVRTFGYDIDAMSPFITKIVGNEAFINAPWQDNCVRLYVIDDTFAIPDDRDIAKFDKFLERWV